MAIPGGTQEDAALQNSEEGALPVLVAEEGTQRQAAVKSWRDEQGRGIQLR